ncbi:uncharacterized protein LOC142586337 [Dermacentor variabilis]|uniref:uncharacterized protein LOC142586337 n=1 Tax=Dermacentor variabilis TaxID=34621 RepID=UPI003F5C99B6
MHCAAVFLVVAFSMAAQGIPSARTFASSQHHATQHHPAFAYSPHQTITHGHQVHVEDCSFVSTLVCQVVKVPVGQSGAQPAIPSHNIPASTAAGSQPVVASSVISSSQDALSNLRSSVRTAVENLVDPVVEALQNASLWLNRTSQIHLNQSHQNPAHHSHQHGSQIHHAAVHAINNHHEHQHMHGGQVKNDATHDHAPNHKLHPIHGHGTQQMIPNPAVPMTVVSVPVLVPAVHAGSFPFVNLSAVVPAGVDVASLQFSNTGRDNATSSFPVASESAAATTHPASTPANSGLVGRAGAPPTAPGTDVPDTLSPDVHTSTAVSDITTVSVWSENLPALARQFPPPVVHRPVCPYDCVPPERRR